MVWRRCLLTARSTATPFDRRYALHMVRVIADVRCAWRRPVTYPDGTEARLGDRVRFSNGDEGVIVFSIDADEYAPDFPKAEWAYLGKGVMVRTVQGALVHYE